MLGYLEDEANVMVGNLEGVEDRGEGARFCGYMMLDLDAE